MAKTDKHYKNIRPGTVVHSNDRYFQGSDGYSKNREAVVLKSNEKGHVVLSKLTTSKNNPYAKPVKNYPGSKYESRNVYNKTNTNEKIKVGKSKIISDENKFCMSNFPNVPIDAVEDIILQSISDKKYGKRNKQRILSILDED